MFSAAGSTVGLEAAALRDITAFFNHDWPLNAGRKKRLADAGAEVAARFGVAIPAGAQPASVCAQVFDALENNGCYPLESPPESLLHYDLKETDRLLNAVRVWLLRQNPLFLLCADNFSIATSQASRVNDFCQFVYARMNPVTVAGVTYTPSTFDVFPKFSDDVQLGGFLSWLFVRDDGAGQVSSVVLYDSKGIEDSTTDENLRESHFASIKRHELGHATIDMAYYLEAMLASGPGGIPARPSQETSAWVYANAVGNYVTSLRARTERILFNVA